jgi:hypothetical protein
LLVGTLSQIDRAHAAAADLFNNLIIAEPPFRVRHISFRQHALEDFRGGFSLRFQSFFEKTAHTGALPKLHGGTAALAFARTALT